MAMKSDEVRSSVMNIFGLICMKVLNCRDLLTSLTKTCTMLSVKTKSVPTTIGKVRKPNNTLFRYMEQTIAQYQEQGRVRTGETYSSTLNSFRRYRKNADITLRDICSEQMESYECYLRNSNLSPNTISFYMKHLRAVYNRAVDEELIVDRHPFKRVNTSIEKTGKRALSLKSIRKIKSMDFSGSPSKEFARDMFLFSFYTRGMSFVDIAFLKKKSIRNGILYYRRKKTNQQLTIFWEPCMHSILQKYLAPPSSPYLFSIIKELDGNHRRQYLNAMCSVNRSLKIIGTEIGLQHPLTMYCARHSWASIARNEGIPLSVISEGMGHDSEKTTQIYLDSLKTEVIDKANRKILRLL